MKPIRLLFLMPILLVVGTARADLNIGDGLWGGEPDSNCVLQIWSKNAHQASTGKPGPDSTGQPIPNTQTTEEWILDFGNAGLVDACVSIQAPYTVSKPVRQLPSGPGSAGLFLSAALTLGAWQVVRSVRHAHLGHLPEWYQSNTPEQIGHAVVFDLQYAPIAPCPPSQPNGEPRDINDKCHDIRSRVLSQFFPIIESPRGPPILSL